MVGYFIFMHVNTTKKIKTNENDRYWNVNFTNCLCLARNATCVTVSIVS